MNQLLRFTTGGSVDDGKSTLIGRLLLDSKSLFEDQLEEIQRSSEKRGYDFVDLSMVTDGLRAEREQKITIDVAHRYFSTPKRKFILADTPGHLEYTRNMVTGASTANLALILVDARKGLVEQTKRHSFIASLLKIPHIVLCINKMDLVDYEEAVFNRIVEDYKAYSSKLEVHDIQFVPISALHGDNVVERSVNMPWYQGATLLHMLESVHIESDYNHIDARFPVQLVEQGNQGNTVLMGRIAGGIFRSGDEVVVWPSGQQAEVREIYVGERKLEEAFSPMSVAMKLSGKIAVSRGDMICKPNNRPESAKEIELMLCWMGHGQAPLGGSFICKHASYEVTATLKEIRYTLDINTLHRKEGGSALEMNDIARVKIQTSTPLAFDSYRKNRMTGSLILIDRETNETVGAGMII